MDPRLRTLSLLLYSYRMFSYLFIYHFSQIQMYPSRIGINIIPTRVGSYMLKYIFNYKLFPFISSLC